MRMNTPVTNMEYELREDSSIVSKTDLKGVITYVNPDFIEASGFTEKELTRPAAQFGAPPGHAGRSVCRFVEYAQGGQAVDRHREEPPQKRRPLLGGSQCHAYF